MKTFRSMAALMIAKNKPYFDAAVNGGLLDKFVGKTLEEIRAMDMTAGANCDGVSALVGVGFYREGLAEAYGVEAYAAPTVFILTDCEAVNVTLNGEAL